MRIKLISPVAAAALVASGLAFMVASSSHAAPERLFFHSAAGGYDFDVADDPTSGPVDDNAPGGSTLSAKAPTGTTDAEATAGLPVPQAGALKMPTFALPFTGDVTSACLDIWVRSELTAPVYDLGTIVTFNHPSGQNDMVVHRVKGYSAGTVTRITALVKPDGVAKIALPASSEVLIYGFFDTNQDWTLLYDSVSHPSNITLNPVSCTPVTVSAPSATPSATASATPSASASATPSATATPTASATATPTGSATPTVTPSVTVTPEPSPTTPPPPARETGLTYTGSTAGRYSDAAPVSARVTLPDGSPVPTGGIEFTLGSSKATFPVNSNGVASGTLRVLSGAGDHMLLARYVANSAYLSSAEETPFLVSRMPAKCAISRTTTSSGYLITGTLRDAANRAIVGQPVFFAYNGTTHHAVKTDRNGRASYPVSKRAGTHTISLRTSDFYSGCAASLRV